MRPSVHAARLVRRNVLEKYLRPLPARPYPVLPQTLADLPPDPSGKKGPAFETAASAPVGTSLQETPPPDSTARTKLATQLPAMMPLVEEKPVKAPVPAKEKEMRVEGVLIPAKPIPPGEEECCMSGCVHCVYTIYADDLEIYTDALSEARQALVQAGRALSGWPEVVRTMEKQGKSGADVEKDTTKKVVEGLDPTMAAFLALENRLKKQQIATPT